MKFIFLNDPPTPLGPLRELLSNFLAVADNILGAILVFLIGWIVARIASRVLKRLLKRLKVDALAERLNEIDIISKSKIRIVPSELLSKILYYILLLFVIIIATDILGMQAVSQLMADIINYIPNLLTAGIVLVIGVLFADFIKRIVLTTTRSLGIPSAGIISNFVFYFLFLAVAMSALGQAKINTEFLQNNLTVIVGGAVLAFAFGYGFASKDMMANFIASFYSKKKINIGDVIQIEGVKGEVVDIDNSSVTLEADNRRVIIPLSKLTSENVEIFREEK
jgi:small-conductance mechanosensitive channel